MLLIIELAVLLLLMCNLVKLLVSGCIIRKRKHTDANIKDNKRFLMIIPVYKEQERIESCIDSIEALDWPKDKLNVCICTTAKEPIDGNDTHTLCEKLISERQLKFTYSVILYPRSDGNMAEQVNYAFNKFHDEYDIVCVYNADSVLDTRVLIQANAAFADEKVNCVQQRAIYNNFNNTNVFSVGYCVYQSVYEIKTNFLKDMRNVGENVVGRAVFLRKDKINGYIYPTSFYCEDMALSFELVSRNEIITSIPSFEVNEPPLNLKDIINQQYVWFHTASKIGQMLNYAKSVNNTKKLNWRTRLKIFHRISENIVWLFTSLTVLTLSVLDYRFLICLYAYGFLLVLTADITLRLRKFRTALFDAFCWIAYLLILSIGPIKYLLKKVAIKFGMKLKDEKYKTPRGK